MQTTVLVTDLMPGDVFVPENGYYGWTVASEPRQETMDLYGNGDEVWTVVDVEYLTEGSSTRQWPEKHGTYTLTVERESEA